MKVTLTISDNADGSVLVHFDGHGDMPNGFVGLTNAQKIAVDAANACKSISFLDYGVIPFTDADTHSKLAAYGKAN